MAPVPSPALCVSPFLRASGAKPPLEHADAQVLAWVGPDVGGELVQVRDGAVQVGVERVVLAELAQRSLAPLDAPRDHGQRGARRLELPGGPVAARGGAVGGGGGGGRR